MTCCCLEQKRRRDNGAVEYDRELFEAESVRRLMEHFQIMIEGMMEDANRRLSQLPMMSEQERQQIVVEWNQTSAEYPRDRCVHELFEQQVEQTPDAVAVVYEAEQIYLQ